MSKSTIEWTEWTDNPIGVKDSISNYCVKISPGCKHCYAEIMARRLAAIGKDRGWSPYKVMDTPPEMELRQRVLDGWKKMKKPRKIFVGSMTDIFGDWVKYRWLVQILDTMIECPHLTFQILTKRSGRMKQVVETYLADKRLNFLPQNIWCGISAENQEYLDLRLPDLLTTKCCVRFLSCEPLLGPLNLALNGTVPEKWNYGYRHVSDLLHWIIVGGESGPHARPMNANWVRDIRNQCNDMDVPFFFKQWGGYRPLCDDDLEPNRQIKKELSFQVMNDDTAMIKSNKHNSGNRLDDVQYLSFPTLM